MIKPHKYLDISNSILSVGAIVLKILMRDKIIRINDLDKYLKNNGGENSSILLMPSLHLLFALDKIEYHKEIDSIEYRDEIE